MNLPLVTRVFGIALMVAGLAVYAALGGGDESPVAAGGAVLGAVGALVYFRGRQLAAKAAVMTRGAAPRSAATGRVLYLRSFGDDPSSTTKKLQQWLTTDEEQLAQVVEPFGALVAVGRPGEPLPLPGAARMYARDDEWRDVVLQLMREARLVILRAGGSRGLRWEFLQAFSHVTPTRLLILSLRTAAADYEELSTWLRHEVGVALPPIERNSALRVVFDYRETTSTLLPGFVSFSRDWSARFLPIEQPKFLLGYNELVPALNEALRPVFERHRVPWLPMRRVGGRAA